MVFHLTKNYTAGIPLSVLFLFVLLYSILSSGECSASSGNGLSTVSSSEKATSSEKNAGGKTTSPAIKEKTSPADKLSMDLEPGELTIFFHSLPGVQYTGFLVALSEGLFEQAGLPRVSVMWAGRDHFDIGVLSRGKATFAVTWMPHAYTYSSNSTSLVVLSRISQKSSFAIKVRKDLNPGITELKHLSGKSFSATGRAKETALACIRSLKIGEYVIRRRTDGLLLFREGYVDALFHTDYEGGVFANYSRYRDRLRFFPMDEAGIDLPEDVLICTKSFYAKYPELCSKMVQAVWEGWRRTVENPKKAIEILHYYYGENAGEPFDAWVVTEQLKRWNNFLKLDPDITKNGTCTEADFNRMRDLLIETKVVEKEKAPTYKQFIQIIPVKPWKKEIAP